MSELVYWLLTALLILLGLRAVLSWFPPSQSGTFLASLNSILFDLTEPVLRPVRRIVPAAGMFDLSFIVVFFAIFILRGLVAP